MEWDCARCGQKHAMPPGAMDGAIGLAMTCQRCGQRKSLSFAADAERLPAPKPPSSSPLARWWQRRFGPLSSSPARERAAAARSLGECLSVTSERIPERIDQALADPRQCWRDWTSTELRREDYPLLASAALGLALREDGVAAVIDWRSSSDEVLSAVEQLADQVGVAPLWTDTEATAWRSAEQLFTWQLVDEIVGRFEAAGFAALDASSLGDGYELVLVEAQDLARATELVALIDPEGDLRPFQRRKFES